MSFSTRKILNFIIFYILTKKDFYEKVICLVYCFAWDHFWTPLYNNLLAWICYFWLLIFGDLESWWWSLIRIPSALKLNSLLLVQIKLVLTIYILNSICWLRRRLDIASAKQLGCDTAESHFLLIAFRFAIYSINEWRTKILE